MSLNNKLDYNTSIYYFLIANQTTKKEIGSFIDNSDNLNNINDLNNIVSTAREILKSDNTSIKGKKNKLSLENHNIYYLITTTDFFYLAAIRKNSQYCKKENLIFELMEDIDHQGIKKLVDKNGELTNVGKQNLKFSIEKYQETNKSKLTKTNFFDLISGSNINQNNKYRIINSQINEVNNDIDIDTNTNNIITNLNDLDDLDNKSLKIIEQSMKFQNDSNILDKKLKCQKKIRNWLIIGICILLIIIIIIYFFVK